MIKFLRKRSKKQYAMLGDFVFSEPFLLFTVSKPANEKKIKKIAESKSKYLLGTNDFFWAYRDTGNKFLVIVIANATWTNANIHKDINNAYPLLLHLKSGKYLIKGNKSYYNISISDNDVKIDVLDSPMDGYVEPSDADLLPPKYKLRWSLESQSYTIVIGCLVVILLAIFVIAFKLFQQNLYMQKKYNDIVAMKKNVKVVRKAETVTPNLNKFLFSINSIGNKINGIMYISKLVLRDGTEEIFSLKCVKKGCLSPIPSAQLSPHGDSYIYKEVLK